MPVIFIIIGVVVFFVLAVYMYWLRLQIKIERGAKEIEHLEFIRNSQQERIKQLLEENEVYEKRLAFKVHKGGSVKDESCS